MPAHTHPSGNSVNPSASGGSGSWYFAFHLSFLGRYRAYSSSPTSCHSSSVKSRSLAGRPAALRRAWATFFLALSTSLAHSASSHLRRRSARMRCQQHVGRFVVAAFGPGQLGFGGHQPAFARGFEHGGPVATQVGLAALERGHGASSRVKWASMASTMRRCSLRGARGSSVCSNFVRILLHNHFDRWQLRHHVIE